MVSSAPDAVILAHFLRDRVVEGHDRIHDDGPDGQITIDEKQGRREGEGAQPYVVDLPMTE